VNSKINLEAVIEQGQSDLATATACEDFKVHENTKIQ